MLRCCLGILAGLAAADEDWPVYLGDKASRQFSAAAQLTPENVGRLEVAWTYASGGASPNQRSQIQCNPLVVDGVLYGTSADLKLFALDAASGEERWVFDPVTEGMAKGGVNRGLVMWSSGAESRLFYGNGNWLHAIDPVTGRRIPAFGEGGSVDLRKGLGRPPEGLWVSANTPGVLAGDLLVTGIRVSEGPGAAAPGSIRAYDVRSGKIAWRFDTIPGPGEFGHDTWPPDAHRTAGGANVWTGFALDEQRGLVFCPTGSAAYDFWGGDRIGENLFANCLIALDAATGERVWHYQVVRHDLWDRDLPAPPNLVTLTRDGRRVDAVAQVTKSGHVFVFERETGEPLFPIRELPVPASELEGESAWPTQPFPEKPAPFSRQHYTHEQIPELDPATHREVLERFVKLRPHVPHGPPSVEGTILFPGFDGGGEWGGAATDEEGVLYVNGQDLPAVIRMVPAPEAAAGGGGAALYARFCAACHGVDRKGEATRAIPPLEGLAGPAKREEVAALLASGKGGMPSFAFLGDDARERLVSYLFGESPGEGDGELEVGSPYVMAGYEFWFDSKGYPAVKPPWGTLNAIDLNTGEYRWTVPLGEYPELTARGIPKTGTPNYGGPVVTAGGLVFIAASRDGHLRAFDRGTGRELWKAKLPAAGYATPAVYSVGGRQFVVIACGGGKLGTPSGDRYVAFALPAG